MIVAFVLLAILIALCIVLISVLSKEKPVIVVQDVTLNQSSYTLEEGQEYQLEADVEPLNATDKTVTWKSSDKNVAEVSAEGLVSAVAQGQAIITVRTNDGARTANCVITVVSAKIHVEDVALNYTEYTLETNGSSLLLEATVFPENATDKSVTWKSSNELVATVTDMGVVTPISAGSAVITVMTNDAAETATCAVTVIDPIVSVNGVELNYPEYSLTLGSGTLQLEVTVRPLNATDKTVTWETSDENIATVTDGLVTPVAAGTAVITVKTNDGGITATCNITVTDASVGPDKPTPVETSNIGITFSDTEVKPGAEISVKLEVTTSRTDYIWQSLDFRIVPLDEDETHYSEEFAKYFEFVSGSYKTNLPAPTGSIYDVNDNTRQEFMSTGDDGGIFVSIDTSGARIPTSQAIVIEFKIKVKQTAEAAPSIKIGVAKTAQNTISYYKTEDGVKTEVTDRANGRTTIRKNDGSKGETIRGDCFKVTPVEMKIKDN